MTPKQLKKLEKELQDFMPGLFRELGRRETLTTLEKYVLGLLLDGIRKSMEPIAARLVDDASLIDALRQRLQQCVCRSPWSDALLRERFARKAEKQLPGIEALIIDDTGFPKKGTSSVGVARQYSGTLGRIENCQVAVSLHLAGDASSVCLAMQLYLPAEWTDEPERCQQAGVPKEIEFQTKWEIALGQLDALREWGVGTYPVLTDSGYGDTHEFREGLTERGYPYLVMVDGVQAVWPPESDPQIPPQRPSKQGKAPTRYLDKDHPPVTIKKLPQVKEEDNYRKVTWREGSKGKQTSWFLALRIRTAHKHTNCRPPGKEQWLLCEWPEGEAEPTRFWLGTVPKKTSLKQLVRLAKMRWRVERDYQEMKEEVGLDHFEGRGWRGFHHHVTLCAVAHGFLALRRSRLPSKKKVDATSSEALSPKDTIKKDRALPSVPGYIQSQESLARAL